MQTGIDNHRIWEALQVLFVQRLSKRQPVMVDRRMLKKVYRERVFDLHPDRAKVLGVDPAWLAERFKDLQQAYQTLSLMLRDRPCLIVGNAPVVPVATASAAAAPRAKASRSTVAPRDIPLRRRLRFAQYLHHVGMIDRTTLAAALRWQRRERPLVGEIARRHRYLTFDDVLWIIRHQKGDERFAQAAVRLGFMDPWARLVVLGHQRGFDRPIGRFFVEHGILTLGQCQELLARQHRHNLFTSE
ncbi:MAG: J domain-containing protein [Vicinamibacteria bacterium]|nr:J domain-containing protein [Vicinamibacteria bacterium]